MYVGYRCPVFKLAPQILDHHVIHNGIEWSPHINGEVIILRCALQLQTESPSQVPSEPQM